MTGEDSDGVGFIGDSSFEHLWSTEERTMMLPALSEHFAMTVSKCHILNSARCKGIKSLSFGVYVLQIHGVCFFFNFWTVGAPSMLLWLCFELLLAPLGPVWTPCLVIGGTSGHSGAEDLFYRGTVPAILNQEKVYQPLKLLVPKLPQGKTPNNYQFSLLILDLKKLWGSHS